VFKWPGKYTDLVSVEIGESRGFVNQSGELKIPSQFSYTSPFDGWAAHVYDQASNQLIIDTKGKQIVQGYLSMWVNSNSFIYTDGDKTFEYTSTKQSAENGRTKEICTNCTVRQVLAPGVYEVDLDGFVGYVVNTNNQIQFLGAYLSSSFRKFKVKYDKLSYEYYTNEKSYYEMEALFDELNTPKDLMYDIAMVKLRIAMDRGETDFSSILNELSSSSKFDLEERSTVYTELFNHFYYQEDYYEAVTYLNQMKGIMDYDQFIQSYGGSAGFTYLKTNNRAEAKRIFESYTRYNEVDGWDRLGFIYFDENDFDMAIKSWNNALAAAKRSNSSYYWENGSVFVNLGASFANKNNKVEMCKNYRAGMGFGNEEATRRFNSQCK
jgi:tetratricopeptide (TPR) repeat protein